MVIAVDGLAGCGKSTIANEIASTLGIARFDTGMLYRAIACEYMHVFGTSVKDDNVDKLAENLIVTIYFDNGALKCKVNGNDYMNEIREERVSAFVSKISPYHKIRQKVKALQRDFAAKNDCVMEGRDIGREVLPEADVKLFLTASVGVRAKRRFDQLGETVDIKEIEKEIAERDYNDIHREEGALIPADDAIIIDSSNMSLEQTLAKCLDIINIKTKN